MADKQLDHSQTDMETSELSQSSTSVKDTSVKNTIHMFSQTLTAAEPASKSTDTKSSSSDESVAETLEAKLTEMSEQIYSSGHTSPGMFSGLVVESVAINESYIAFLLDDGRVCRLGYRVKTGGGADTTITRPVKHPRVSENVPGNQSGIFLTGQSGSSTASRSSRGLASAAFIIPAAAAAAAATTSDLMSRSGVSGRRAAHLIRAGSRSGITSSAAILSGRVLPVPESLIESVQTVLQSKSRSVIIRELQRTNLDVNLAVNNLLQRDDEADEAPTDTDDDDAADAYMHGDDLISLLDINTAAGSGSSHESIIADHQDPDVVASFRLAAARRFASASLSKPGPVSGSYRLRDNRWYYKLAFKTSLVC